MQKQWVVIGIMACLLRKSNLQKWGETDMCPYQSNWKNRGREYCDITSRYHCVEMQDGDLVEVCTDPITIEKGFFPVWSPYVDPPRIYSEPCRPGFYNDGKAQSNTFNKCKKKSECEDEGQVSSGCPDGDTTSNRQCRCDYENNYISGLYHDPAQNPEGRYCFTLKKETSSCYKYHCEEGFELDMAYRCVRKCEDGKKRPSLKLECVPVKSSKDNEKSSITVSTTPPTTRTRTTSPSANTDTVSTSTIVAGVVVAAVAVLSAVIISVFCRKKIVNIFGENVQYGAGATFTAVRNDNSRNPVTISSSSSRGNSNQNITAEAHVELHGVESRNSQESESEIHHIPSRNSIAVTSSSSSSDSNQNITAEVHVELHGVESRNSRESQSEIHHIPTPPPKTERHDYLCLDEKKSLITVLLSCLEFYNKIAPKSMSCETLKRELSDYINNNPELDSLGFASRQYDDSGIVEEWKKSEDFKIVLACGMRYEVSVGIFFEDRPDEKVMIVENGMKCLCLYYSCDGSYSSMRSRTDIFKSRRLASVIEDKELREKHALLKKKIDDRIRQNDRLFQHFKLFASVPVQGESLSKCTSPIDVLDALERHQCLDVGSYHYLIRILDHCEEQQLVRYVREIMGNGVETLDSCATETPEQTKMFRYTRLLTEFDDCICGDELDRFILFLTEGNHQLNYLKGNSLLMILSELGAKGFIGPDNVSLLRRIAESLQSGRIRGLIENYEDSVCEESNPDGSESGEDRNCDVKDSEISVMEPLLASKETTI